MKIIVIFHSFFSITKYMYNILSLLVLRKTKGVDTR